MNKLIIALLGIWLLYITYVKIMRIKNDEKVRIIDNIIAIILGGILAIFEWNIMYNGGWHLYFISLVVICSIVPIYYIVKKYII